jgi:hypothetical protein
MPLIPDGNPVVKKRLDVRYMSSTKDRSGGGRTAYGWHRSGWNVIFPETVLRRWFQNRGALSRDSLYATLGVARSAQPEEIRRSYFRLARQWHPDVARDEPQAADMFMQIHDAYEVLRDAEQRARYDAGLALQAAMEPGTSAHRLSPTHDSAFGYRPPLRCGLITVEGTECLGRFTVDRILAWDDIVDAQGRTLVTVWPAGADTFTENWVFGEAI